MSAGSPCPRRRIVACTYTTSKAVTHPTIRNPDSTRDVCLLFVTSVGYPRKPVMRIMRLTKLLAPQTEAAVLAVADWSEPGAVKISWNGKLPELPRVLRKWNSMIPWARPKVMRQPARASGASGPSSSRNRLACTRRPPFCLLKLLIPISFASAKPIHMNEDNTSLCVDLVNAT
jgi:hypothetical protein